MYIYIHIHILYTCIHTHFAYILCVHIIFTLQLYISIHPDLDGRDQDVEELLQSLQPKEGPSGMFGHKKAQIFHKWRGVVDVWWDGCMFIVGILGLGGKDRNEILHGSWSLFGFQLASSQILSRTWPRVGRMEAAIFPSTIRGKVKSLYDVRPK